MISKLGAKFFSSPLAKQTLLKMCIRLSVVITLASYISYHHIFDLLDQRVRNSLIEYIAERGEKESKVFLDAERNHRFFEERFLEQWSTRQNRDISSEEKQLIIDHPDGTRRLNQSAFDGTLRYDGTVSRYISAYIGQDAPQTNEFLNKLILSYELVDRYGEAWSLEYANLYVSMPDNVNLVYWPEVNWGQQAESDLDVNQEEWVYVANGQNNPEREQVWTGLYYDQPADEWMVSLVSPVYQDDEHLINVGHDILLNKLFDSTFNDKLPGTENLILRSDGRVIASQSLVDELREHKGLLHVNDIDNIRIKQIVLQTRTALKTSSETTFLIESEEADALLAVTEIEGPDWYFVNIYPKSLLSSAAKQTALIVCFAGLFSLVVELIILFFIMRDQVIRPLNLFTNFSKSFQLSRAQSIADLKNDPVSSQKDEIGFLARTLLSMASLIHKQNLFMEEEIRSKTDELNQTNQILEKEVHSRKTIMDALQTIAKDVSGLQGVDYFDSLGEFLSTSLEADMVVISKLSKDKTELHGLSVYIDGRKISDLSYPIKGTPCEKVINEGTQTYNGNVQELFPDDADLVDLSLNSYIGTPMQGIDGEVIGHLAVLKRDIFKESNQTRLIINSVTSRASSELLRSIQEHIISKQAETDGLTGVCNRSTFIKILDQAIHSAERRDGNLAVIFIDIDNFKMINDQLGHAEGDTVLKTFAERMQSVLRAEDTIGRLGGDEFVVLLSSISESYAIEKVAQALQHEFSKEIKLSSEETIVTCSLGVAVYPGDGLDHDALLKSADTAMYRAKELGRNNIQFFTPEMNAEVERVRKIEHDLSQSIIHKHFEVYYQPIVNLMTGEVVKLEALVRWNDPQRGIVCPAEFIPIAERTGQITNISELVLEQVCVDFERLKDHFEQLERVTINCSARVLQHQNCHTYIAKTLKRYCIEPSNLELEITESIFIDNQDNSSIEKLNFLRDMGVSVSLDDFGTGYSSLSYLRRIPVDCLKIDRSFIQDVLTNADDVILVENIVSLAKGLNLSVVVEGIEEKEQGLMIKRTGCNLVQGYYFSRPLPMDDLLEMDFDFVI